MAVFGMGMRVAGIHACLRATVITLNRARDYRVDVELRQMGWIVMHIWECEIDETALQILYQRIVGTPGIGEGYASTSDNDGGSSLAAEPPEAYGLPY